MGYEVLYDNIDKRYGLQKGSIKMSKETMVKIVKDPESANFQCYTPYCEEFVRAARERGGLWSDSLKCWLFDVRDEMAVRGILVDTFGTDDYELCEKCTIRVDFDGFKVNTSKVYIGGRLVVRRTIWKIKYGEGVVVISGEFYESRRGDLYAKPGTVVEIRDMPKLIAEKLVLKNPEYVWIIGGVNKTQLLEERAILQKRIEQIDELIAFEDAKEEEEIIIDLLDDNTNVSSESSS